MFCQFSYEVTISSQAKKFQVQISKTLFMHILFKSPNTIWRVVVLSDAFPKTWSFFHDLFIIDLDSAS